MSNLALRSSSSYSSASGSSSSHSSDAQSSSSGSSDSGSNAGSAQEVDPLAEYSSKSYVPTVNSSNKPRRKLTEDFFTSPNTLETASSKIERKPEEEDDFLRAYSSKSYVATYNPLNRRRTGLAQNLFTPPSTPPSSPPTSPREESTYTEEGIHPLRSFNARGYSGRVNTLNKLRSKVTEDFFSSPTSPREDDLSQSLNQVEIKTDNLNFRRNKTPRRNSIVALGTNFYTGPDNTEVSLGDEQESSKRSKRNLRLINNSKPLEEALKNGRKSLPRSVEQVIVDGTDSTSENIEGVTAHIKDDEENIDNGTNKRLARRISRPVSEKESARIPTKEEKRRDLLAKSGHSSSLSDLLEAVNSNESSVDQVSEDLSIGLRPRSSRLKTSQNNITEMGSQRTSFRFRKISRGNESGKPAIEEVSSLNSKVEGFISISEPSNSSDDKEKEKITESRVNNNSVKRSVFRRSISQEKRDSLQTVRRGRSDEKADQSSNEPLEASNLAFKSSIEVDNAENALESQDVLSISPPFNRSVERKNDSNSQLKPNRTLKRSQGDNTNARINRKLDGISTFERSSLKEDAEGLKPSTEEVNFLTKKQLQSRPNSYNCRTSAEIFKDMGWGELDPLNLKPKIDERQEWQSRPNSNNRNETADFLKLRQSLDFSKAKEIQKRDQQANPRKASRRNSSPATTPAGTPKNSPVTSPRGTNSDSPEKEEVIIRPTFKRRSSRSKEPKQDKSAQISLKSNLSELVSIDLKDRAPSFFGTMLVMILGNSYINLENLKYILAYLVGKGSENNVEPITMVSLRDLLAFSASSKCLRELVVSYIKDLVYFQSNNLALFDQESFENNGYGKGMKELMTKSINDSRNYLYLLGIVTFGNRFNEYLNNNQYDADLEEESVDKVVRTFRKVEDLSSTNGLLEDVLANLHTIILNNNVSRDKKTRALNLVFKLARANQEEKQSDKEAVIIRELILLGNCAESDLLKEMEIKVIEDVMALLLGLLKHSNDQVTCQAVLTLGKLGPTGIFLEAKAKVLQDIFINIQSILDNNQEDMIISALGVIDYIVRADVLEGIDAEVVIGLIGHIERFLDFEEVSVISSALHLMSDLAIMDMLGDFEDEDFEGIWLKAYKLLDHESVKVVADAIFAIDSFAAARLVIERGEEELQLIFSKISNHMLHQDLLIVGRALCALGSFVAEDLMKPQGSFLEDLMTQKGFLGKAGEAVIGNAMLVIGKLALKDKLGNITAERMGLFLDHSAWIAGSNPWYVAIDVLFAVSALAHKNRLNGVSSESLERIVTKGVEFLDHQEWQLAGWACMAISKCALAGILGKIDQSMLNKIVIQAEKLLDRDAVEVITVGLFLIATFLEAKLVNLSDLSSQLIEKSLFQLRKLINSEKWQVREHAEFAYQELILALANEFGDTEDLQILSFIYIAIGDSALDGILGNIEDKRVLKTILNKVEKFLNHPEAKVVTVALFVIVSFFQAKLIDSTQESSIALIKKSLEQATELLNSGQEEVHGYAVVALKELSIISGKKSSLQMYRASILQAEKEFESLTMPDYV